MRDLAARIGISDVGLKKLLRSHGIAAPPQGHWNRVHAGKAVMSPPKPPQRGPGESGRVQGHAPRTEAANYGSWDMETLRAEVEKLPRYEA